MGTDRENSSCAWQKLPNPCTEVDMRSTTTCTTTRKAETSALLAMTKGKRLTTRRPLDLAQTGRKQGGQHHQRMVSDVLSRLPVDSRATTFSVLNWKRLWCLLRCIVYRNSTVQVSAHTTVENLAVKQIEPRRT